MHGPDGRDYPNKIIFLEVLKPERLVYKHSGEEDTEDINFHVTITFEAVGDNTQLTMRMVFPSKEELERVAREYGAIEGAHQHIARLEEYVSAFPQEDLVTSAFEVKREFDAPRELVFKVFSEAKHLAQWWGPKGMKINIFKLDFRQGGICHYNMVGANGSIMWGRFIYRQIQAPEKIVFINSFSDEHGGITRAPFEDVWPLEMINNITLTEKDGKTILSLRGGPINATAEEHTTYENGFASMQQGYGGTFDQLRDYLKTLPH
jgi:uncharacterized protein YndB with AHSA1/START domain